MHTAIGIFRHSQRSAQAVQSLLKNGVPPDSIIWLCGEHAETALESLPTSETEAEGMGKTMGAYLGAVLGAGAGAGLGSAVASLLVPGVGAIFAAGLGAAAALGLGGAAVGASLGHASEDAMELGIPRDDVFFYRSLLKDGHALVLVNADTQDGAAQAQRLLIANGSEDADAARTLWSSRPDATRLAS